MFGSCELPPRTEEQIMAMLTETESSDSGFSLTSSSVRGPVIRKKEDRVWTGRQL